MYLSFMIFSLVNFESHQYLHLLLEKFLPLLEDRLNVHRNPGVIMIVYKTENSGFVTFPSPVLFFPLTLEEKRALTDSANNKIVK